MSQFQFKQETVMPDLKIFQCKPKKREMKPSKLPGGIDMRFDGQHYLDDENLNGKIRRLMEDNAVAQP